MVLWEIITTTSLYLVSAMNQALCLSALYTLSLVTIWLIHGHINSRDRVSIHTSGLHSFYLGCPIAPP